MITIPRFPLPKRQASEFGDMASYHKTRLQMGILKEWTSVPHIFYYIFAAETSCNFSEFLQALGPTLAVAIRLIFA
jgi:hypothetical protein